MCYFSYGTFTSVTWHDRKIVIVVTSFPMSEADSDVIERSVKIGGHWEKKNFRRTGVINLYNTYMGGVDVSDQTVSSYTGLRWPKNKSLYKGFFFPVERYSSFEFFL